MAAPLILVDGSSYLFRAYHVPQLQRMSNGAGQPTGAVFGVINMIKSLLEQYDPIEMAVVFDAKGKNFRHAMYADYKAHRPPMPEELRSQIAYVHRMVEALGIPLLMVEGVEADDVIGTLAAQATLAGCETLISTGDKDMAQLVNDHVKLINTMDKENPLTDAARVVEKFGVRPDQIIDYLALLGDAADNIPGVPKVGAKTAAKWLSVLHSIDEIKAQAHTIGGKVGESLRAHLEQLDLARALTTIRCDVDLPMNLHDLTRKRPNQAELLKLFEELEFKSWMNWARRLNHDGADGSHIEHHPTQKATVAAKQAVYETILSLQDLARWMDKLAKAPAFALDTETTSLNYMQAKLVGISLSVKSGEAAYIPLHHDYDGAPHQLSADFVLQQLKPHVCGPTAKVIGQHFKYDWHILKHAGLEVNALAFDTMLASYVLNSTTTRHNMDDLAAHYLGYTTQPFEAIAGKGKNQLTFNQIPIEKASFYACEDADVTFRLYEVLSAKLAAEPLLDRLLRDMELPLSQILAQMEETGVHLDDALLAVQSGELAAEIAQIQAEAEQMAGEEFNLDSPKQVGAILFEKLALPVVKKTPKGEPSTNEESLSYLAQDYPLPQLILDYRSLSKLKSTYTDALPLAIEPTSGRVHTSYHQAVTATGRLSSSDPNLQNIPVKSPQGRRIRQAFCAPTGLKIMAADYSQIELRIMAHLSKDKGLLAAFAAGEDIHRATAAEIFGLLPIEVTPEQRRSAKAINFGLIYGMSAFGLAKQLGVGRNEAQAYMDAYFERYPGVKTYMHTTRDFAIQSGYVETIFGRRLYLPDILSNNRQAREYAERTAINAPMQGSAADIIKRAMLNLDGALRKQPALGRMVMQVHDELVFEVAENQVDALRQVVKTQMESAAKLAVPLVVDVGVGRNWDEAH